MKTLLNSKDIEAVKSFFIDEMDGDAFKGIEEVKSFDDLTSLFNSDVTMFLENDIITEEMVDEVPNIMELIILEVYVAVVLDGDIDSVYSEDILDDFGTCVAKATFGRDIETLKRLAAYSSFDELLKSEDFDKSDDDCDTDFPYTLDDFEIPWDKLIDATQNLEKMPGFYKPERFWEKLSKKAKQILNKIKRKHV